MRRFGAALGVCIEVEKVVGGDNECSSGLAFSIEDAESEDGEMGFRSEGTETRACATFLNVRERRL